MRIRFVGKRMFANTRYIIEIVVTNWFPVAEMMYKGHPKAWSLLNESSNNSVTSKSLATKHPA